MPDPRLTPSSAVQARGLSRRALRALPTHLRAMEARLSRGMDADTVLRTLPRFLEEGCRGFGLRGRLVLVDPAWAPRIPHLLLGVRSHLRQARAAFAGLQPEDAPHLAALERFLANVQQRLPAPPQKGELVLVPDLSPAGIAFTPECLRSLLQRQPPGERLALQGETLLRYARVLEKGREREPERVMGVRLPAAYPVAQALVMLSMLTQQAMSSRRTLSEHDLPTLQRAVVIAMQYRAALASRGDPVPAAAG